MFQPFDILLPPVTNNQTEVLTFAGATGTNAWTRVGLIDDVRVTYAGPVAFENQGFEAGDAGWTFLTAQESGASNVKSGLATAYGNWVNRIVSGKQAAFLQRMATVSQSVDFPEGGAYTVSFLAASRSETGYQYTGHEFAVEWDGEIVGTVKTEDYLFARYTFRLPHVAAGTHTLTFRGSESSADKASTIDDVRVERLAVEADAFAPFPPRLKMEVAEDARLSLDFEGVQPLYRLRIGGRGASGLISAATHPGVIFGPGVLSVPPSGTVFWLQ